MKFFPDLYIEENEKVDDVITLAKLRGYDVKFLVFDGVNYLRFENKSGILLLHWNGEVVGSSDSLNEDSDLEDGRVLLDLLMNRLIEER